MNEASQEASQSVLQTLTASEPAIAAIVEAIDPKIAATVALAEAALGALRPLVARYEQIKAAKDGIDPALWDAIVADKESADAAVLADAPKA